MRYLKNNFSNQEQLLGQLRDVLQSNNQRLQSKEKEVQVTFLSLSHLALIIEKHKFKSEVTISFVGLCQPPGPDEEQ
jgi:hypothetical protein